MGLRNEVVVLKDDDDSMDTPAVSGGVTGGADVLTVVVVVVEVNVVVDVGPRIANKNGTNRAKVKATMFFMINAICFH